MFIASFIRAVMCADLAKVAILRKQLNLGLALHIRAPKCHFCALVTTRRCWNSSGSHPAWMLLPRNLLLLLWTTPFVAVTRVYVAVKWADVRAPNLITWISCWTSLLLSFRRQQSDFHRVMEFETSLTCSQEPACGPCAQPDGSSPHSSALFYLNPF